MTEVAAGARLSAVLRQFGYEVMATDLADVLWLARFAPALSIAAPSPAPVPTPDGSGVSKTTIPPASTSGGAQPSKKPPPTDRRDAAGDGIYLNSKSRGFDARMQRATAVRAPSAPALPHALELSRALRPLLRKRVSTRLWHLDEELTVEETAANRGIVRPVFRPDDERWFEVALVVDDAPSMSVWRQAVVELRRLLMHHGGFRDLRQYRLCAGRDRVELVSEAGHHLRPDVISDPSGHRLIVVVSDAVSPAWRARPVREALYRWGRLSPVVFVHVLPSRMWPHTGVGFADRVMRPARIAAPNVEWRTERDWQDLEDGGRFLRLPVISLQAEQFARWAESLMEISAGVCTGAVLAIDVAEDGAAVSTPAQSERALSPAERLQRFRSVASPAAYQLACFFAATQLALTVMRIVQRRMMPETGPVQLAEFLLGGLIYRPGPSGPDESAAVDADNAIYEFHPGVRDLLLDQLQPDEVPRVVNAIEEYLRVHFGRSFELATLILDEAGVDLLPAGAVPFVRPTLELMKRMGFRPAKQLQLYGRLVDILASRVRALRDEERARLSAKPISLPEPGAVENPSRCVLVVGGRDESSLNDFQRRVAIDVGFALAEHDFGLIVGGWPGVDAHVARAYAFARAGRNLGLDNALVQLVAPNLSGQFSGGRIVHLDSDEQFLERAFEQADGVVLIGGQAHTLHAGREAYRLKVPIVPVGATGGVARVLFHELATEGEFAPDDVLNVDSDAREAVAAIVRRVVERLREQTEPNRRLRALVAQYLASSDVDDARVCETRMLTLARRFTGELVGATSDGTPEADLLNAVLYRARPEPEHTPVLFQRHASLRVVWQRVSGIPTAFTRRDLRLAIPRYSESVSQALEAQNDSIDTVASQLIDHSFVIGRLMSLGRLRRLAESARSARFKQVGELEAEADAIDDAMAVDCLRDPHPGWRLAGLLRIVKKPMADAAADVLAAIVIEPTFPTHQNAALEAMAGLIREWPALRLNSAQRHALESLARLFPKDRVTRRVITWLETAPPAPVEDPDATLAGLVARYNEIRGAEVPGHERTLLLLDVVKEMHDVVRAAGQFDVISRLDDADRGWRLAAYVYAYETKDPALYAPLCRSILKYRATKLDARISNDNRPFGEKEALLALEQVDGNMSELPADHTDLLVQLRESLSPGPERKSILSRILARRHFSASPGKKAGTAKVAKPPRPKKSASSSIKRPRAGKRKKGGARKR